MPCGADPARRMVSAPPAHAQRQLPAPIANHEEAAHPAAQVREVRNATAARNRTALTNPSSVCSFHVADLDALDRDHFTSDLLLVDTAPAFNELKAGLTEALRVEVRAAQRPARRWG